MWSALVGGKRSFGLLACLSLIQYTSGFYLPGVAPTSYDEGELVPLHVNKIIPIQSENDQQLRSAFSYEYYNRLFHFCEPEGGAKDVGPESLGAVIFGDRIKTSPFELKMKKNETCKKLCEPRKFQPRGAQFFNNRIRQNYAYNWLVDGLPAGQMYATPDKEIFYSRGFPLGKVEGNASPQVYNHYNIIVEYHETRDGKARVVGALVQPASIRNFDENAEECMSSNSPMTLNDAGETQVQWSYSIYWMPSNVAWASRWDTYLHVDDPKIHWFSLINSTVIVFFLVGTVSAILTRALRKDFARYNRLDTFNLDDFSAADNPDESVQEDSGWKLVHGDVFRSPPSPLLLSVFLGNGAQLFLMTGITIAFALLGFLSPSNRGSLGTAVVVLYTFLGFVGGYVSARVYKTFGGEAWKRNIILTPVFVPGIVFGAFFIMNFFLWIKQSSGAVPFTTMLVIVGLWFLITLPLSVAGSWVGFRQAVSFILNALSRSNGCSHFPLQYGQIKFHVKFLQHMLI
jgi:transmembrane 9 superfamily member 2/4